MAKFMENLFSLLLVLFIVLQLDGGFCSEFSSSSSLHSNSNSNVRFPIMLKKKSNFISVINGKSQLENPTLEKDKGSDTVELLVGGGENSSASGSASTSVSGNTNGIVGSTSRALFFRKNSSKNKDNNNNNHDSDKIDSVSKTAPTPYIDIGEEKENREDLDTLEEFTTTLNTNANTRNGKFIRTNYNINNKNNNNKENVNNNNNNGVSGYTVSPAPTPSYRPSTSYYSPTTKPAVYYKPSASTSTSSPYPIFTTTETIPIPTTMSTTTMTPIIPTTPMTTTTTTTRAPPPIITTTFRPIIFPTQPPPTPFPTRPPGPTSSTFVPIIGIEDEDEDEFRTEKSRFGLSNSNNNNNVGVTRSFFSDFNRDRANRRGNGGPISRGILQPRVLPNPRALKFDDDDGEDSNVVKGFVFSDIKCYRTKNKEYFGATIHMKNGYHLPYIRDRPQDPLTSSECRLESLDTSNTYRMTVMDLRGCGVEQCGEYMCLTMVFPRVPTLALKEDEVTTIKCEVQKSSMSETRSISFAGDNLESRRSSSTVVGGGQEFEAELGVFRQTPGAHNGLFAQRVISGGTVQMGEPLQLRSVVRGGDGWTYSKLADVKVWRMRGSSAFNLEKLNPHDASEVITLVDGNGCRNSEYEVIAESHPIRDPRNNLVHHFTFKAFLFRGQRANEPLIVTAKVQACQDAAECKPSECIAGVSSRKTLLNDPNVNRFKRSPDPLKEHHNVSSIVHDFSGQLALLVQGHDDRTPPSYSTVADQDSDPSNSLPFTCTEKMAFSAAGACGITIFICGLAYSLIYYSIKNKRSTNGLSPSSPSQNKIETLHSQNLSGTSNPFKGNNNNNNNNGMMKQSSPSSGPVLPRKRDKPLPPPPKDYDQVPPLSSNETNNNNMMLNKSGMRNMRGGAEYECIDEIVRTSDRKSKDDEEVYVVYCYNGENFTSRGKKKNRPTSAPPSLREKRRSAQRFKTHQGHQDGSDETEESEKGSYTSSKRTVRSVKRVQNEKRGAGVRIRRRLSSIYREVYGNRNRSGSFPTRISPKNVHGSSRRQRLYSRENERDADPESSSNYHDGFSSSNEISLAQQQKLLKRKQHHLSSDELDSAYCGSSVCGTANSRRAIAGDRRRNLLSRNLNLNLNSNNNNNFYGQNQNQNQGISSGSSRITSSDSKGTTVAVADYSHLHQRNPHKTIPDLTNSTELRKVCDDFHCCGVKTGHHSSICSLNPINMSAGHFVSRTDSSTKIIIVPEIPETDV